jgi:hypothetical protein
MHLLPCSRVVCVLSRLYVPPYLLEPQRLHCRSELGRDGDDEVFPLLLLFLWRRSCQLSRRRLLVILLPLLSGHRDCLTLDRATQRARQLARARI